MDDRTIKTDGWFRRLFCFVCHSKRRQEPVAARYDVHKRRKKLGESKDIVRHVQLEDELETGSINVNKNFFD